MTSKTTFRKNNILIFIFTLASFSTVYAGEGYYNGNKSNIHQGQGQNQTQEQDINVNMTESSRSNTYRKYTPPGVAPSISPSARCYYGSIGVGVPGFSASGGAFSKDIKCEEREIIRLGFQSGNPDLQTRANILWNLQMDEALARYKQPEEVVLRDTDTGIFVFSDN